jgi:hypothetical protein
VGVGATWAWGLTGTGLAALATPFALIGVRMAFIQRWLSRREEADPCAC